MTTNIIEGNPTKKFFIEMITRDISIEDAIIDLLDNSIDGANRINQNDYSNLYIDLTVNGNEFIIRDNCLKQLRNMLLDLADQTMHQECIIILLDVSVLE